MPAVGGRKCNAVNRWLNNVMKDGEGDGIVLLIVQKQQTNIGAPRRIIVGGCGQNHSPPGPSSDLPKLPRFYCRRNVLQIRPPLGSPIEV